MCVCCRVHHCATHTEESEEIWRYGASREHLDQASVFKVGARKSKPTICTSFGLFLLCSGLRLPRRFGGNVDGVAIIATPPLPQYNTPSTPDFCGRTCIFAYCLDPPLLVQGAVRPQRKLRCSGRSGGCLLRTQRQSSVYLLDSVPATIESIVYAEEEVRVSERSKSPVAANMDMCKRDCAVFYCKGTEP